jgi:Fic family protein
MARTPYRRPFQVTSAALATSLELMRLIGQYEGLLSPKPQPKLRRHNQIRTVLGSLSIEGNTLSLEQVTALLDHKRVLGSKREILEVENAIKVYAHAQKFDPSSPGALLRAHEEMMRGLIPDAGRYRTKGVGIFRGKKIAHVAPPPKQVARLVEQLLSFIKADREVHPLIKAAVAHYELEFIHPFSDGNGRMGRLWQHVMLVRFHPVFEYLPIESVIHAHQKDYYRALAASDKAGNSTAFIELSLTTIRETLETFLRELKPPATTSESRIDLAREFFGPKAFSRRDYLAHFKTISTATASRDLRDGVVDKQLVLTGTKALARYRFR